MKFQPAEKVTFESYGVTYSGIVDALSLDGSIVFIKLPDGKRTWKHAASVTKA